MTKRWLSRGLGLVAVLVAVGLAAGCGSSNNNSTSSSAASASTAATATSGKKAAAGTPVKVMVVSSENGSFYNYPDVWPEAEAYAKWLNEQGGINGHPLEIVRCNDKGQADLATRCARQAVSDKVTAFAGGVTVYGSSYYPILESKSIPWINDQPQAGPDMTSPMSFVVNGNMATYQMAISKMGNECKRPGVITNDLPIHDEILKDWLIPALKSTGASKNFVVRVKAKVGAPDFTPAAQQLKQANIDCIYPLLVEPDQKRFLPVLKQYLPNVKYYGTTSIFTPAVAQSTSAANGAFVASMWPGPTAPQWKQALSVINNPKYYSGDASKFDIGASPDAGTWAGLTIFDTVAKTVKGDVTPKAMLDALNSATNVDTNGLTPPIDFSKPATSLPQLKRLRNFSAFSLRVEGQKFVPLGNTPQDEVPGLVAGLKAAGKG